MAFSLLLKKINSGDYCANNRMRLAVVANAMEVIDFDAAGAHDEGTVYVVHDIAAETFQVVY